MENMVVWVDIPVTDLDRAMKFYSAVLQHPFTTVEGMDGIGLPAPETGPQDGQQQFPVAFDLMVVTDRKPSAEGCTVYLNSYDDPEGMLQRAVAAGGRIDMPATDMGQMVGTIGAFIDSEGNRIGVRKPPQM